MHAKLKVLMGGITQDLSKILDRERLGAGYANRVIYKIYKNRQRTRFQTENESEGEKWKPLDADYEKKKRIKFAEFDGKGQNIMVATGRLKAAVTGDRSKKEHRKIVLDKKLQVNWTTPYAEYTEDVRPVNVWSEKLDARMYEGYVIYILSGVEQRTDDY